MMHMPKIIICPFHVFHLSLLIEHFRKKLYNECIEQVKLMLFIKRGTSMLCFLIAIIIIAIILI